MLKLDLPDGHLQDARISLDDRAYCRVTLDILVPREDIDKVMQALKAEMNLGHTDFKREKGKKIC